MIRQFFITNKSGGMIFKYEKDIHTDINSLLVLTSSLYSINVISSKAVNRSVSRQTVHFRNTVITIFKTITGTAFIFVADSPVTTLFDEVYAHYCSFVTKNPFYSVEMPINCAKFQPHVLFSD